MNNVLLFLLLLCQLLQQICGQWTYDNTPMPISMPKTAIVNNGQCLCYTGTTCPTLTPGIDIRIVNTGTTCPSGQVYCCVTPTPPPNPSTCGISKIPPSPHPPGEAAYGAYPWQVAIVTNDMRSVYLGGGVLVSPMYVLTAAHKVQNYVNGGIKAVLGCWGLGINEPYPCINISISKVTLNPNYRYISQNSNNLQNIPYDIAVLRLSSAAPIETSPNINTACLPSAATGPVAAGTRCWVTGWGKTAFGSAGTYPRILKEADVPVKSQAECQAELLKTKRNTNLDNTNMCAGGELGKDACTGDGGSPLVCPINNAFYVYGLVSWGIGCADAGVPGVYTNVYYFIDWIRQQMM